MHYMPFCSCRWQPFCLEPTLLLLLLLLLLLVSYLLLLLLLIKLMLLRLFMLPLLVLTLLLLFVPSASCSMQLSSSDEQFDCLSCSRW